LLIIYKKDDFNKDIVFTNQYPENLKYEKINTDTILPCFPCLQWYAFHGYRVWSEFTVPADFFRDMNPKLIKRKYLSSKPI